MNVDRAIAWNLSHGVQPFRDPSTLCLVRPETAQGVRHIARRQRSLSITVDGKLGPQTRGELESRYGPLSECMDFSLVQPWYVHRWGYDHGHEPSELDWPIASPAWHELTSDSTWRSAMLRLVSGHKGAELYSRPPHSVISLDTLSLGIAHWWAETIPEMIVDIQSRVPEARTVWPIYTLEELEVLLGSRRGKSHIRARHRELIAGWWRLMRNSPDAIAAQCDVWLRKYVPRGADLAGRCGWQGYLAREDGGRILAACTRAANSGAGWKLRKWRRERFDRSNDPIWILRLWYASPQSKGGYDHSERFVKIMSWDGFSGPAPKRWR